MEGGGGGVGGVEVALLLKKRENIKSSLHTEAKVLLYRSSEEVAAEMFGP